MTIGQFLMQKRSMNKRLYPGRWSVTGGAVDLGESTVDAVYRECKEELGIDVNPDKVELMMSVKRKNVFVDIFLDKENWNVNDLKLQEEEVDDVKWFDRKDLKAIIEGKETSDSIIKYFDLLCDLIDEK